MSTLIDYLWKELEPVLGSLAHRLKSEHKEHQFRIGHSCNHAFPMRAFMTIQRSNDGEELTIAVDVKSQGTYLVFDSDVSGDNGDILIQGPSLILDSLLAGPSAQQRVDEWIDSFQRMLLDHIVEIKTAIQEML